jgi:hypothetical protein
MPAIIIGQLHFSGMQTDSGKGLEMEPQGQIIVYFFLLQA